MKITSELTVRTYECDSYGHVNNAVYVNYLEYGRMEYLNGIGFDYKGIVAAGYALYISHIDIHYKASSFLGDKLFIDVWPVDTGAVKGTLRQVIRKQDGTVCVEADVTWATVNAQGRPTRLPKEYLVPGLYPDERA
ncbi:MAG: acyl-CoA thioesterase [Treponema sp.]|nr:acyl-CoA thioesterase [Treponema sp.]MBQ9627337.1 acyl-CoA thioesterase [Treponema sp.]